MSSRYAGWQCGYGEPMTSATVRLHHHAQGDPEAPAVLLGGSLGTTLALWDSLADALAADYHVVRFDTRGHGSSPAPPGPYTMSGLSDDVLALADRLGIGSFSYVGLSIGGAMGLTLALDHPERLDALAACCTAPVFGDPATWRERSSRVTAEGVGWLVEPTVQRWFTAAFRAARPGKVETVMTMLANTAPVGYAGCCDANATYDITARLAEVRVPTRVVAGAEDPTAGPDVARMLVDGIHGADLVVIEDAAHIANVAQPERFNLVVREHLDRVVRA
jgi:3-oxoadipate enol-lactonase